MQQKENTHLSVGEQTPQSTIADILAEGLLTILLRESNSRKPRFTSPPKAPQEEPND